MNNHIKLKDIFDILYEQREYHSKQQIKDSRRDKEFLFFLGLYSLN